MFSDIFYQIYLKKYMSNASSMLHSQVLLKGVIKKGSVGHHNMHHFLHTRDTPVLFSCAPSPEIFNMYKYNCARKMFKKYILSTTLNSNKIMLKKKLRVTKKY